MTEPFEITGNEALFVSHPSATRYDAAAVEGRLVQMPGLGRRELELLHNSCVVVVGLGALGGQLVLNLAMLGVPLILIDDGEVEPANLGNQNFPSSAIGHHKAAARARQVRDLNPTCPVRGIVAKLEDVGMAELAGASVIATALDTYGSRLHACEISTRLGIPMIDAAVDGALWLLGRVSAYGATPTSPCFACSFDGPSLATALANERPRSCASWRSMERAASASTLQSAALASIVGGIHAQWIVHALTSGIADLDGRRVFISADVLNPRVRMVRIDRNAGCPAAHDRFEPLVCFGTPTVGTTADAACSQLGAQIEDISLHRRSLVFGLTCTRCGKARELVRLADKVTDAEVRCSACHSDESVPTRLTGVLQASDVAALGDRTWAELGFARADVVTVRGGGRRVHTVINVSGDSE